MIRIVGKCNVCEKNGYVNNVTNLCRKCQKKQESG